MSAVDVTNQGGTMSENLRDKIARAMYSWDVEDGSLGALGWGDLTAGQRKVWLSGADAVLVVVGPELDRLRAEVTGTAIGLRLAIDERDDLRAEVEAHRERANSNFDVAMERMAERDVLRARIKALADDLARLGLDAHERAERDDIAVPVRTQYALSGDLLSGAAERIRAALASVPEPSDNGPAANPRGDDRETASEPSPDSNRRHDPDCLCTTTDCEVEASEPAPDADREAGERCTCGAPDAYALTPGETIVHRRDGEPCYIAQSADGASQPPVIREAGERA